MTTQYREVSRKARVGELVRVFEHPFAEQNGTHTVTGVEKDGHIYYERGGRRPGGYVVLEPVESAATLPEILTQFLRENAATVRKFLDEIEAPEAPVQAQPKPLTRAEVVAKAKADIAELMRIGRDIHARLTESDKFNSSFFTAEFFVNREKRAVTALVSTTGSSGNIADKNAAKATAKCAPGDVFHTEIGKAIALRKALGLPVPDEYINAPKPEPAPGAVVQVNYDSYTLTLTKRRPEHDGSHYGNNAYATKEGGWIADKQYEIIDDTDVDYENMAEGSAA